jgi:outer membrane protein OmpA-like peptidoglycan-associated protein
MPPVPHTHPPLLTLVFSAAVMALTVSYAVEASSSDASSVEQGPGKAPYEPPTLAASAVVLNKVAAYRVDQGVVKFFFASGKSQLVQGADQALQDIVAAVQTGRRVQISGFHDATGDAPSNAELAKQRALAVQKKLLELGVPAASILLQKPAVTVILGSYAEARRVEVTLIE